EAPIANITSHNDGDIVSGVVELIGQVADANPKNTHFKITRPGYSKSSTFYDGRSEHTFNWNTNDLVDGTYTIQFEVRDLVGNKEMPGVSVKTIEVYVDNTDPTIVILDPDENTAHNGLLEIRIKGVDSESGIGQFVANLKHENGTNLASCVNVNGNGVLELEVVCTINTTIYSTLHGNGNYYIKTNVRDLAGNLSNTLSLNFIIDNAKPNANIVTPENGAILQGDFTVEGTA